MVRKYKRIKDGNVLSEGTFEDYTTNGRDSKIDGITYRTCRSCGKSKPKKDNFKFYKHRNSGQPNYKWDCNECIKN